MITEFQKLINNKEKFIYIYFNNKKRNKKSNDEQIFGN